VVRSLGGVASGGVVGLLLRVTTASTCSSMMTTTTCGVVTMSMAMVVIVGGRRGHVVTAVGQMRRVLHTHLMSVMMGHMTLGRLHQRGLDVGHKLGHPAATFNYCSLFLVVCLPGLGLGNTYLIFHFLYEGVFRIVGEGVGVVKVRVTFISFHIFWVSFFYPLCFKRVLEVIKCQLACMSYMPCTIFPICLLKVHMIKYIWRSQPN